MMNRIPNTPLTPGYYPQAAAGKPANSSAGKATPFQSILNGQLVKFSQHAETRLRQRGIELSADKLADISSAIDKAASKGAKDSLILTGDLALIVNVKNKTVVTAMDHASMKNNVFTQIDSAVVL